MAIAIGRVIINGIWLFCARMSKHSTQHSSVNVAADIMSGVLWDVYIVAEKFYYATTRSSP